MMGGARADGSRRTGATVLRRGSAISGIVFQAHGKERVFETITGSAYPPQIFTSPEAGLTNAMLFAGAIVFRGQPLPKGNSDARSAVSFADQQGVAIFLAMPMLFGRATRSFTIADIQTGSTLDISKPTNEQRPSVLTASSTRVSWNWESWVQLRKT